MRFCQAGVTEPYPGGWLLSFCRRNHYILPPHIVLADIFGLERGFAKDVSYFAFEHAASSPVLEAARLAAAHWWHAQVLIEGETECPCSTWTEESCGILGNCPGYPNFVVPSPWEYARRLGFPVFVVHRSLLTFGSCGLDHSGSSAEALHTSIRLSSLRVDVFMRLIVRAVSICVACGYFSHHVPVCSRPQSVEGVHDASPPFSQRPEAMVREDALDSPRRV